MGEFSSSDSSWKKIVLTKSDNEWSSTSKAKKLSDHEGGGSSGLRYETTPFGNIKHEIDDDAVSEVYQPEDLAQIEPIGIVQELDPLMLNAAETGGRRRRSSGPRNESAEERSVRLAKMSAYAAQRLASETAEQRATRLKRMSAYAARRLANETPEQRAVRLQRMSAYAARRLARETPEQRSLRLSRMSAYAARRQALKKLSTEPLCPGSASTDSHSGCDAS